MPSVNSFNFLHIVGSFILTILASEADLSFPIFPVLINELVSTSAFRNSFREQFPIKWRCKCRSI